MTEAKPNQSGMIYGLKRLMQAAAPTLLILFGLMICLYGLLRYFVVRPARVKTCMENLDKIDRAKEDWAIQMKMGPGTRVTVEDIVNPETRDLLKQFPECPSGGSYTIHPIGTHPTCSTGLEGHALSPSIEIQVQEPEFIN